MQSTKTRYYLVDGLRGIALINMVIYHYLYDVFVIYGRDPSWHHAPAVHLWQQMICWSFIFISGFVWPWGGAGNVRRGLRLNLYGLLITLVTWLVTPGEAVWFGILTFIGCAILIMVPLQKLAQKIPPVWGLVLCFFLFIFCKQIQYGTVGIGHLVQIKMPDLLYAIKILTPLGFPFSGFQSSDYFPLLPWMFLYLCGYFFNTLFAGHPAWQRIAQKKIPILSAIGRKTIAIYLLHQPVNLLICQWLFG